MDDPITPAATALVAKLNHASIAALGVAATSVHYPTAPSTRTWPYIVLTCDDAPERDRTFGGPTWTDQVWSVTAVVKEDPDTAAAIAGAVNALLDEAVLTIGGGTSLVCVRRRAKAPRPVQGEDDVVRWHAGGEYQIGVGA